MRRVVGGSGSGYLLLIAVICGLPVPGWGWGAESHRIICEIAWQRMSPDQRSWISSLRADDPEPSATFAESCVWADQVRDSRRHDTAAYHYINLPPGADGVDLQRDCPTAGRCLPWAVRYYSAALQNKRQSRAARAEALKFLAHFVGDLHQPLHVAYAADRGGNTVLIDFLGEFGSCRRARQGKSLSLHEAWDDLILRRAGWRWRTDGPRLAAAIDSNEARHWSGSTVIDWTNETFRLCEDFACSVPAEAEHCSGMRFKKIDQPYFERARKDVERQLQKAGVRLASLVEKAVSRDQ